MLISLRQRSLKYLTLLSKKQLVPCLWKLANIIPIPKETPFETCNQLQPISLTDVIMRLFERVVVKQELSPVLGSAIGPDHFAYKEGWNTTLALLTCHHHWLKWLDGAMDFVRVFFLLTVFHMLLFAIS